MSSSSPEKRYEASTFCSELSRKVESQFLVFVIFYLEMEVVSWHLYVSCYVFHSNAHL